MHLELPLEGAEEDLNCNYIIYHLSQCTIYTPFVPYLHFLERDTTLIHYTHCNVDVGERALANAFFDVKVGQPVRACVRGGSGIHYGAAARRRGVVRGEVVEKVT